MHKKTKKEILDRCKDLSVLSRFGLKMALDPWYVKLIRHIRVIDWISNCNQYYKFKKRENVKFIYNDIAKEIVSDFQFGYTREMLWQKLIYGAYGNAPMEKLIEEYEKENKHKK